jgi:hypothetical protein
MDERYYGFHRALVVGTARNTSKHIKHDLLRIVNSLDKILPTTGFVVESDSEDDTIAVLENLSKQDSRMRYTTLGNLSTSFPNRILRLRHCRNAYIHEIRVNPEYKNCDLIVVADLDGINTKIDSKSFEVALNSNFDWDVLAANQLARYYDILALRHPLWSPNNWLLEEQWYANFVGAKKAKVHSMSDRMIRIPTETPPIEVESAFGGLALYKRWVFENTDYSEDCIEAQDEIDHVTLHRKVRTAGGKIFIHPGLINSTWTNHSLNGSRLIRSLKWLFHISPLNLMLPFLRKISIFVADRS